MAGSVLAPCRISGEERWHIGMAGSREIRHSARTLSAMVDAQRVETALVCVCMQYGRIMTSIKSQRPDGGVRLCPSCQIGYIMRSDLHPRCETCLGPEHAGIALTRQPLSLADGNPRHLLASNRGTDGTRGSVFLSGNCQTQFMVLRHTYDVPALLP
ncbi:hypothetical protein ABVT39_019844 [Epinephelus coioides]